MCNISSVAVWTQYTIKLGQYLGYTTELAKLRDCWHFQLVNPNCRKPPGSLVWEPSESKIIRHHILLGLNRRQFIIHCRLCASLHNAVCRRSGLSKTWENQPRNGETFQNLPKIGFWTVVVFCQSLDPSMAWTATFLQVLCTEPHRQLPGAL